MTQELLRPVDEQFLTALAQSRERVDQYDQEWFEALDAGQPDTEQKRAYKAALAAFRALEREAMDMGVREVCGRCGGDGVVHWGNVNLVRHVQGQGNIPARWCFECAGHKFTPIRKHRFETQAPTRLKKKRAAEAKRAQERQDGDTKWAAFAERKPEIAAFLAGFPTYAENLEADGDLPGFDRFLADMRQAVEKWGDLTEGQQAAVERNIERKAQDERAAQADPAPRGAQTVEGEVVSIKDYPGYAGGKDYKMLVLLDDGNKVWGSVPAALWSVEGEMEGCRVKFTADFHATDDDHFSKYKRPRAFKILEVAGAGA